MSATQQPRSTADWYAVLAKHDDMRETLDILQPYAKEKYGMPAGIEDLVERALKPWSDLQAEASPSRDELLAANDSLNARLLEAEKKVLELTGERDAIRAAFAGASHELATSGWKLKEERDSALAQVAGMQEELNTSMPVVAKSEHDKVVAELNAMKSRSRPWELGESYDMRGQIDDLKAQLAAAQQDKASAIRAMSKDRLADAEMWRQEGDGLKEQLAAAEADAPKIAKEVSPSNTN